MPLKRFMFLILYYTILSLNTFCFSSDNPKLREYYKYIRYAELNITENNLKQACSNYKLAFCKADNIFIKDCYNALICSFRVSDYKLADKFLKLCLESGYNLEHITNNPSLKDIWSKSEWGILMAKYKNYIVTYDTSVYNKYSELKISDQKVRKYCQEFGGEQYSYSINCLDSVKKIDYKNLDSLLTYINRYGFPDELTSGVTSPYGLSNYYLTLLHNISWGNSDYLIKLKELVYEGYCSPNLYHELATREFETNGKKEHFNYGPPIGFRILNSNNSTTLVLIVSNNESFLNEKRENIYLEPLSELREKIRFSINRNDYAIINKNIIPLLDFTEDEKKGILDNVKKNYPNSIILNY